MISLSDEARFRVAHNAWRETQGLLSAFDGEAVLPGDLWIRYVVCACEAIKDNDYQKLLYFRKMAKRKEKQITGYTHLTEEIFMEAKEKIG